MKPIASRKPISVIGSINYDVFVKVAKIPVVGETVLAQEMDTLSGGKGANQAIQASRLGASVHLIGAVGKDVFGSFLISDLKNNGLSVERISLKEVVSGTALVHHTASGESSITVYPGANHAITIEEIDACKDILQSSSLLIMQSEIPLEIVNHTLRMCQEMKLPVLYNPSPVVELSSTTLEAIDIMIMNEVEACYYCGLNHDPEILGHPKMNPSQALQAGKKYLEQYGGVVVITLGEQGCVVVSEQESFCFEAIPTTVVETTGAGDSFAGGFAVMHSQGHPLWLSARVGLVTSSLTIQGKGAQTPMPFKEAVIKSYQNYYKEQLVF